VLWVGESTVYDLKKQNEQLLKFYVDSEVAKLMDDYKKVKQAKTAGVDGTLHE
jgi:hypothetical protein